MWCWIMPPPCSGEMNKFLQVRFTRLVNSRLDQQMFDTVVAGRYRETCSLVSSPLCRLLPWQFCSSAS